MGRNNTKFSSSKMNNSKFDFGIKSIIYNRGLTNGNGLSDNNFICVSSRRTQISNSSGIHDKVGFTNGNGLSDSNGLTDGNGLTNGNGLTLTKRGLIKHYNTKHRAAVISNLNRRAIKNKVLGISIIVLLLMLPLLLYSIEFPIDSKRDEVYIDNEFGDWERYPIYTDTHLDQQYNPNIDILKYQIYRNENKYSVFLEVDGKLFHGTSKDSEIYPDSFSVLIDADSNPDTGYSTHDIGAEYLIDLQGAGSRVTRNSLYQFDTSDINKADDWKGWDYVANANVGIDQCRLECEVTIPSLSSSRNNNYQAMILSKDIIGNQDYSDNILSSDSTIINARVLSNPPSLLKAGETHVKFLTIEFAYSELLNDQISTNSLLDGLVLEYLGNTQLDIIDNIYLEVNNDELNLENNLLGPLDSCGPVGALGDMSNERTDTSMAVGSYVLDSKLEHAYGPQPFIKIEFQDPIELISKEKMVLDVLLDLSPDVEPETCLGLRLNDIMVTNSKVHILHDSLSLAYIENIPETIKIDGAFGDWGCVNKLLDVDDARISNPALDCEDYAIVANDDKLNFYFKVSGELLKTNELPIQLVPTDNKLKVQTSNSEKETLSDIRPPIPAEFVAKDTLRVFLDTDLNISTGFNPPWLPIGAEFMLEVSGRNGMIINKMLYRFNKEYTSGTIWSWESVATIPVEKDQAQIEMALNTKYLDLDQKTNCNIFYILSNWDNSVSDFSNIIDLKGFLNTPSYHEATIRPNQITRANNPYISGHNHPYYAGSDNSVQPVLTNLDEDSPGDGAYEISGKDISYSWIECGYNPYDIPLSSTIHNMTIYMGYRCDVNWGLSSGHKGIIWSNISGSIEHNITNYELTTTDKDVIYTSTNDLPSPIQFNNGIYIRINGKDNDGSGPDYFNLDYLYFTVNYSIPDIVINEIMFDPTGNDNSSEWVELYNAGETAYNLTKCSLIDSAGNKLILTSAGTLEPGKYLMCHIAKTGVNSSSDIYSNILFQKVIQPNASVGKDNYLDESSLNGNYGTQTSLNIIDGLKDQRPLIQFDLSEIPITSIRSSSLWLYRYAGNAINDADISVHRVTCTWTETGSCWNTYDGANDWPVNNNGGDWDSTVEDSTTIISDRYDWYSWNITDLTKRWKNGTYQNYGVILLNADNDPTESFYSSDYSVDPSLRPKLIVNYWSSLKNMLDDSDSLTLIDQNNNILDYLAWGSDPGANDDAAVLAGIWSDGAYIDTSNLMENETLGRNKESQDTDTTADWENATTLKADPYGINASAPTPGGQNSDPIIPEFEILAIPVFIIALIYFCISRNQTSYIKANKDSRSKIFKNKKLKANGNKNAN